MMDNNTIHRALELNATITKLREENGKLRRQHQLQNEREEQLLDELDNQSGTLFAANAEAERLKEVVKRQQISLDCLYSDLEETKKTVERLRQELIEQKMGAKSRTSHVLLPKKQREASQATHLIPVMEKSAQVSKTGFFSNFVAGSTTKGAHQRKIQSLEMENKKLKSELVCIQAKYREEAYLKRKMEEIESLDENGTSVTLTSAESLHSTFVNNDDSDDCSSEGQGGTLPLNTVGPAMQEHLSRFQGQGDSTTAAQTQREQSGKSLEKDLLPALVSPSQPTLRNASALSGETSNEIATIKESMIEQDSQNPRSTFSLRLQVDRKTRWWQ